MTEQTHAHTSLSSVLSDCMQKVGESLDMIEALLIDEKTGGCAFEITDPEKIIQKLQEEASYDAVDEVHFWPSFTAWSKHHVYFLIGTAEEYTDSYYYVFSIGRVSRHPTPGKPRMERFPI